MPTLPTFTVTDAVAQRLLAAFAGQVDENANPLTPQMAYKMWLRKNLTHYVRSVEVQGESDTLEQELPL